LYRSSPQGRAREPNYLHMANSARNSPPAQRCGRYVLAGLAWFCVLLVPISARAGRVVRIYEVDIKGEASAPAVEEAMRHVLVRATGRREAAGDPTLSTLVAQAPRYVRSSRRTEDGNTRLIFDGAAIEQAVTAAGRSVWQPERPFTIVVFYPPLAPAAADTARSALDKVAETRGLPITIAPVAVVDAAGNELPRDTLLQAVQRLGGDAVLVGRGDNAALNGQWQWTLHTAFASESWTGALEAGVNGAVDAMARVQDASFALAELETAVQVNGVSTLNDYAAVGRLLDALPGVRHVNIAEANGGTATFAVLVRGGADAVDRALSGSAHLARSGAATARLAYEYHP
jgi:hypothetical protein